MPEGLKQKFVEFVMGERDVVLPTAKKYAGAVDTCSRILAENGVQHSSLHMIDSMPELLAMKERLFQLSDFIEINTTGNNMYSCGVDYWVAFRQRFGFGHI